MAGIVLIFASLGATLGFWASGAALSLAKTAFYFLCMRLVFWFCVVLCLFLIGFLPVAAGFPATDESFVR